MAKERLISLFLLAPLCFSFCLFLAYMYCDIPKFNIPPPLVSQNIKIPDSSHQNSSTATNDTCRERYIYVHDLPPRFNKAILEDCENLIKGTNLCRYLENDGFGPHLESDEGVFLESGWYDTNQFALDLIFHSKMKQYNCLTNDSSLAAAVYVPFYAGFDISRHLSNYSIVVRDSLSHELIKWLKSSKEWSVMGGKDHFLVSGRITWEFRRLTEKESDFGNNFLLHHDVQNMTTINIESSPWDCTDFAAPYPTYFHPSKDTELVSWQNRIRKSKRKWLFSFAGGPRPWDSRSIRNDVFDQCKNSKLCKLFKCVHEGKLCSPSGIIGMFKKSHFCLQPSGDSATRKSIFDAILAGCIPVFFHPAAAYLQYKWYLPTNYTKYSVFIWEDDIRKKNISIEETLNQISAQRIKEMRKEVIDLIPKIIYAGFRSESRRRTFKDAFDIAVEAVIQRVTKLKQMNDSKDDTLSDEEVASHQWDTFLYL